VAPSRNRTLPVGVPNPEDTFAVKTTACPAAAGFGDALKAVDVAAGTTVCVRRAEV
jgi:hypothetical protein